MRQIKDIFNAYPTSAINFMREPGQGFYIPAYQRQFSWSKSDIERLFDDVSHGVHQLINQQDATTFIGTLITIHDTEYTTIDPIVRQQVPGKVMTVIDGQQRLTTLLLTNVALHNELDMRHRKLRRPGEQGEIYPSTDAQIWIHDQCVQTLSELIVTIEENMSHGDGDYQWYPRMIRAYDDQWSRRASEARYNSDIALLLHSYGSHVRAHPHSRFAPAKNRPMASSFETVRTTLRKAIARDDHDTLEYPQTAILSDSAYLANALFRDHIPDETAELLASSDSQPLQELFRLLTFARFILHRVAITVVTATTEDYAFDMFESLNTTGQPLTAFETFKPRVIKEEGHANYQSSESERHMRYVEDYLENYPSAQSRQQATTNILIPFALAETGFKLPKRLSDQRRYLKDEYESLTDSSDKLAFVRQMAHTTLLVQHTWDKKTRPESGPTLPGVEMLDAEEKMCFSALRDANHSIAIGLLARFYSARREGYNASIGGIIRAVTAFFGLWRGALGGTSGIEDKHRSLMARGIEAYDIRPLARQLLSEPDQSTPDIDVVKEYFRVQLLHENLGTRDEWIDRAKRTPVFTSSSPLTRLLLLAAMHDTIPDPDHPGLVKPSRSGVLSLFNYDAWIDSTNITVEHIAPQTPDNPSDWPDSLYMDSATINCLGNLLLLPVSTNASLSNRSWTHKRAIYRILAAQSPDDAESAFEEAVSLGIDLSRDILTGNYMPLTASVAAFEEHWDVDIVEMRSERLLGVAWDRLAPWLGYEE